MVRTLFIHLVLVIFAAASLAACKKEEDDTDDADGNPPVGTVDNAAGFYLRYRTNKSYTYDIHKGDATYGTECKAEVGESIDCFLEVEELDFAFHGVDLQYNVPSTMCSYVTFEPYFFFAWSVGDGPDTVISDTDQNGNVGRDADNNGTIDVGVAVANCQGYSDGIDFFDFDHSNQGGPNCCAGTHTRIDRVWNPDINNGAGGYDATTTNDVPWGGNPADCYEGPAKDSEAATDEGIPSIPIYFVEGVGLNDEYNIRPLVGVGVDGLVGKGTRKSLYSANFIKLSDHAGNLPEGLRYHTAGGRTYPTQRYYRLRCLDRADDIISEIRLQIREWNTKAAFDLRTTSPTNHDVTGTEPDPFDEPDDPTDPDTAPNLNDWFDWKEFNATGYPNGL